MNRLLVIGGTGTGTVGRQVVSQLTARGVSVRMLARNPEASRFPPGIEVMRGDLTLPETLDACLKGIDTVFLVWTAPAGTAAAALERITQNSQRIVFLSAPLKTPHPLFQQPNAGRDLGARIEQLLENSGREWTFLRPGMFAHNSIPWWAPLIRKGEVVRWPYLSVPTAPIDERDIARVAVQALCQDGHARAEYVLTGPQSLSQFEQLSTIGQVLGRSLRIEEISPDEARKELLPIMPLVVANMLLAAWGAAMGQPAFVTCTVAEITGSPATPFVDWVSDHAAEFRG